MKYTNLYYALYKFFLFQFKYIGVIMNSSFSIIFCIVYVRIFNRYLIIKHQLSIEFEIHLTEAFGNNAIINGMWIIKLKKHASLRH